MPWQHNLCRTSRNDKAIVRWAFQSLSQPVGFAWKSLYESGSPSLLKGCVVREAVHHAALGRLPFVSPHLVRLLAAATKTKSDVQTGT